MLTHSESNYCCCLSHFVIPTTQMWRTFASVPIQPILYYYTIIIAAPEMCWMDISQLSAAVFNEQTAEMI